MVELLMLISLAHGASLSDETVRVKNIQGQALAVVSTAPVSIRSGLDMAAGNISGGSVVHKFGQNPGCSTTEEDVWAVGGTMSFSTSAAAIRIRSGGNANDTAAGTGAQSVIVFGLDSNFTEISNVLTTNGASASTQSTGTFRRVYRAYVYEAGTYGGNNTGNVVIESTDTANAHLSILAGIGQSQTTHFTIPSGKTGYLVRLTANVASTKPTTIKMYRRESADDYSTPFSAKRIITQADELSGYLNFPFDAPVKLPAKTDVWSTCKAETGTSLASVEYNLMLVSQ